MAKSNKKIKIFPIFLAVYSCLLISIIVFGLNRLWGLLEDYEAGLAEVTADKEIGRFYEETLRAALRESDLSVTEFENVDVLYDEYEAFIDGKEITYKRKGGDYTAEKPVYYVLANEQPFAEFSLKQTGTNGHGFPVWELDTIVFLENMIETQGVEIKVPKGAAVYINGVLADSKSYINEEEEISLAKNISGYVEYVPAFETYIVDGLIKEPQITVEADNISERYVKEGVFVYEYPESPELAIEHEALINRIGRNYGGYIINKVSYSELSRDLTGNAKSFMSNIPAIWAYLYGEEYTYDFNEWNVSNVKKYSEECFSCDIDFVLTVTYRVTRQISYDTKLSCMFIEEDGKWYLADFTVG